MKSRVLVLIYLVWIAICSSCSWVSTHDRSPPGIINSLVLRLPAIDLANTPAAYTAPAVDISMLSRYEINPLFSEFGVIGLQQPPAHGAPLNTASVHFKTTYYIEFVYLILCLLAMYLVLLLQASLSFIRWFAPNNSLQPTRLCRAAELHRWASVNSKDHKL